MKKNILKFLIILIISMCMSLLLPNYFKGNQSIEWPGFSTYIGWCITILIGILLMLYATKPKEKSMKVPDGYNELFNSNDQITKKGMFYRGQLVNGTKYIYNKDGTFSHIENCINGVYTKTFKEK
jgi:hypothetical protein